MKGIVAATCPCVISIAVTCRLVCPDLKTFTVIMPEANVHNYIILFVHVEVCQIHPINLGPSRGLLCSVGDHSSVHFCYVHQQ